MNKYEAIYKVLVEKIISHELQLGTTIAAEEKLAKQFNVSRVTIRRALVQLEKDGYIRKQQGKGSVVVRSKPKSKTVLLILPNVFDYIFKDLIQNIEAVFHQNNITLLIANSYNDQAVERQIISNHIDYVDGIIFEPVQVNMTKYENSKTYHKLLKMPSVCLNTQIPGFLIPALTLDDFRNLELVTNYVLSQNVKRILIFAKTDDMQGLERLKGIHSALSKFRGTALTIEFTTDNEAEKMNDLAFLYFNFKPQCLMFYNDDYAQKFMDQYDIDPSLNQLLITGFDNTNYSQNKNYKFISPDHPKGKMGLDAAQMMIDQFNNIEVESYVYPPHIDFEH